MGRNGLKDGKQKALIWISENGNNDKKEKEFRWHSLFFVFEELVWADQM